MAISVKHNSQQRTIDAIKAKYNSQLRNITEIKVKLNGVVRVIWEAVTAFIFSSDGFGIQTSDGYIVKFKDEEEDS